MGVVDADVGLVVGGVNGFWVFIQMEGGAMISLFFAKLNHCILQQGE